jgi:polyisoprenoid-binding protein YceI
MFLRTLTLLLVLTACAPAAPDVPSPAAGTPALPSTPRPDSGVQTVRLQVADGAEARYRAREQLAERPLPNEAIGKTNSVTGALVLTQEGKVVRDGSRFTVDLRSLTSDIRLRDQFIQRSTLQTDKFPNAEFVPADGAATPFPRAGQADFQLPGELTVHGVTKPVTLQVSATITGQEVTGTATTGVTLADFGMQTPRVPLVLSIEETIRLEVDFKLVGS